MKSYFDLIDQTFEFPTEEFKVNGKYLEFHGVPLKKVLDKYGTPLRITYLPKISQNIQNAKKWFADAIKKHDYNGTYTYCYCTKSSHFEFVLDKVIENNCQIETSSAFDIQIVRSLYEKGKISKDTLVVCNGFKRPLYTEYINGMINDGFDNLIPILDNLNELDQYKAAIDKDFKVGIRVAADEEPNFEFYTSRLGIRYSDIISYYKEHIQGTKAKLKMLHFFINTGIRDTAYYWSELSRFMYQYCELKKICPELDTVDIGGGFPIKTSLTFEYDYAYMVDQIVENIKWICNKNNVPVPNLITEFGSFTVGESGAFFYSILDQKQQNDKELWYMIDGSFITHLPDAWGLNQKYILLAISKWDHPFHRVNLGGLTCDSMDYYNSEAHSSEVFLPYIEEDEKLYVGFFHTGAYQESLGGYGGIQHCLIPAPKHLLIDRDENGKLSYEVFAEEQTHDHMLKILGY
ncbi:arginine decarboxylase [Roseivirga pacifica]|uniref:Arginine decarboxylase n=1 Tax=Roseivirga pacifica TaxID=1267423 RepID=A0A1I0RIP9_9BACT|nr:arginine decarboxylase [Roseivirga pacifica]MCO6357766.1 arginine decarboxylase [Roseivirga pacifica]MCO6366019.1 arginine decarboxylase [Roseivirga pacifica]MCO6371347.1 arginine decarboxylase [Roseivirga pacifica]MCO6375482.1 arginine decarboxylase [Roseivirga pacifica]MCO6378725.1 arginine decarboxylase [Roseivirga pacifica]